jgi:tetratricopeptide (TPR) repeat protein
LYLLLSGSVILFVFLITKNPSNNQYILAKSIDSTYRHNQKIADSLGISTYGNIQSEDVIKAYEESIASDSSNVEAIKSLGKFYFRQAYKKNAVGWDSDYSNAIPYFLKLINTEAESSDVYYLLAWSLMGSSSSKSDNNIDFAIEKLFEATHKYPKEASLFHLIGNAYYLKEDYDRALNNYLKESELNSEMWAGTYFQIGECYSHLGDKKKQIRYYNIAAKMGYQKAIKALSELK